MAQRPVLDRVIQVAGALIVAVGVPLGAQFPKTVPYVAAVTGVLTYFLGRMPPGWEEPLVAK